MTRTLFDSSVLIAALWDGHERHDEARPQLAECHSGLRELLFSAHALAETFSTLTALPISPRISPRQAMSMLEHDALRVGVVIPLDADDYAAVLERMVALGLTSGAIYDSLHVRAAEKAGADELYTFNGRDFRRMLPTPPCRPVVL